MAFESKLTCDALGCFAEFQLQASHPSDAETEMHQVRGWLIDEYNNFTYCPKCREEVLKEMEDQ